MISRIPSAIRHNEHVVTCRCTNGGNHGSYPSRLLYCNDSGVASAVGARVEMSRCRCSVSHESGYVAVVREPLGLYLTGFCSLTMEVNGVGE